MRSREFAAPIKPGAARSWSAPSVEIEEYKKNRFRIVVSEMPFQQTRDGVVEKIAALVKGDKVKGISAITDLSDLKEPVKLSDRCRSDADPEVVLNQLYQFSPLQTSFSMNFLALVDGKPRELTIKDFLREFFGIACRSFVAAPSSCCRGPTRKSTRSRVCCWRLADIDQIIEIIRQSKTQAEAKQGLMGIECPASMMERALGDDGFTSISRRNAVYRTCIT